MSLFKNSAFVFQRLANDMGIVFQSRRFLSQYSVTRALFGVSKTEQQRDEEILNPPPLRIYHCKRDVRGMPRKMNSVAFQIRRLPIEEAITQMRFSPKKAAETIKQTLEEAQQLAVEKYHVEDKSNLWVVLQEGPALGKNKKKRPKNLTELKKIQRHPLHIQNSLSNF